MRTAGDALTAGCGKGPDADLDGGGLLADSIAAGRDDLRGGAGGAAATRRKRTEKLLEGLHGLLTSWGDGDAEDDATGDADAELLFSQLEQLLCGTGRLIRSRPCSKSLTRGAQVRDATVLTVHIGSMRHGKASSMGELWRRWLCLA